MRHAAQLLVLGLLLETTTGCDASRSLISPEEASFERSPSPESYALTATASSFNAVDLAWVDVTSSENGYEVQRSTSGPAGPFVLLTRVGANVTSWRDGSVAATTSYCYRVASYRETGRTLTYATLSSVSCTTTKLAPPSNVRAAPLSSSSVTITWTAGAGTASGFLVERGANAAGPWTGASTTAATVTTFVDTDRIAEQLVCYRVTGLSPGGPTAPSNVACATPLAAPTNLVASTAADGIDLTWQDNSSSEFLYLLERASDGVTFTLLTTLPANTTHYHEAGVASGTTYWYRIRAKRNDVMSDLSATASAAGGCVPTGAEVCDNGVDDDCNGFTDLADPACGQLVDCFANPCGSGTICDGQFCVSSCHDGYRDSDESDVDCGGGCGPCQTGQSCWGSYDCASNNCVYQPGAFQGVCQPPVTPP